jgi:hypothetical protein
MQLIARKLKGGRGKKAAGKASFSLDSGFPTQCLVGDYAIENFENITMGKKQKVPWRAAFDVEASHVILNLKWFSIFGNAVQRASSRRES